MSRPAAVSQSARRWGSVKMKFPAVVVLAAAIPVAALAIMAYATARSFLRESILEAERSASFSAALLVQAHLENARHTIAEAVIRPGLTAAVHRQDYGFVTDVLTRLTRINPDFRGFVLLDPRALVLAVVPTDPTLIGADRSSREYFRAALERRAPYVSDVFVIATGRPVVVVSAPIIGPGGEVAAVLGGSLSLTRIQSMMASVAQHASAIPIVVDRRGVVVSHPNDALIARGQSFAEVAYIQEALRGRSGTTDAWNAVDGQQRLAVYAPVPDLGWAVSVERPTAEVYAPIARLRRVLLVTGVGLLAATLFASVLVASRIARPLDRLASVARRFGEGDWSARAPIDRRDEIGEIARAFNGMATRVPALEQDRASYAQRLELLHQIDQAIITAAEPVAIAEAVLPRLRDLLGVPRAIVNLFDLEAGEVEWLAAVGRRRIRRGPGVRFPLTLMGDVEALRRGEVQVIDTTALPPSAASEALLASGILTYMVVPMIARGELIGAVSFGGAPGEFPPAQISIAQEVAAQLAIAIAQARLHERVKRQAEELEVAVNDRTRDLERERSHLEAILTGMAEGVCVIDTSGRVLMWNDAAERIYRLTPAAMIGTTFPGPLRIVDDDERVVTDFSDTLMKRALDTGAPVSRMRARVTRPDGTDVAVAMTAAPVRDAAGRIFGCVNVFRDVTLELEVDRMKSEFVSTVSHELRTPLTSIRAYAETLRDMVGEDRERATVQEFLTVIEEEAVRLTRLINDLLNVSRIESGRIEFKHGPVTLEPLVRRAVQTAQPKAAASEVVIEVDMPPSLPRFLGDADAIQQVLTNLVDNAVKYNRRCGRVEIRAWLNGGLEVEVRDTGLGMSAPAVRRLGERFFRVDSSETRRIGGTGLGMTLVKELLHAHGVELEIESVTGKGSAFRFLLPLVDA